MPRFRIAWVMVAIAIAALDFAAIRAFFVSGEVALLVLGALPMATILAVGILIAQQRPGSRPFLLGFEAFGAMALATFIAFVTLVSFFPDNHGLRFFPDNHGLIDSYLAPVIQPIEKSIGQNRPFVFIPIVLFAYVVMFGWPQLVFALIGGSLSRRFRITITRR
jgi:hypothetical protein